MTLKRYLILGNGEHPEWLVSRYVATGDPANDAYRSPAEQVVLARQRAEAASRDWLAPGEWCSVDADLFDAQRVASGTAPALPAQVSAFLARNLSAVDRFIHYADVELASAWIDHALERAATDDVLNALPAAEQFARVTAAWEAFGNAFKALNLRPYGWAPFRLAWQTNVRLQRGVLNALAPSPAGPFYVRPVPFAITQDPLRDIGPWRANLARGYNESRPTYALPVAVGDMVNVVFGTPDEAGNAREPMGDDNGCGTKLLETARYCRAPSGEVHRLWLGNDGAVTVRPPGAGDWNSAWRQFGGYNNGGHSATLFAYAPMRWYLNLLRPLLATLRGRDLLSIVYEAHLDVLGKNAWTLSACGRSAEVARGLAEVTAVEAQQANMDGRSRLVSIAGTAVGLVAAVNPVVGACLGVGVAVLGLVNQLAGFAQVTTGGSIDIFGRAEPALEVLQFDASARPGQDAFVAGFMPPAPPGGVRTALTYALPIFVNLGPTPASPVPLSPAPMAADVRPVVAASPPRSRALWWVLGGAAGAVALAYVVTSTPKRTNPSKKRRGAG